ncbi:hypothetical protein DICPUDRAFT_152044 [Dictyostelium purpureum]|uniref:SigF-like NTF2-like domain-containing protein n=1 Tax=Dictyostelium purpureum TaxID=5786 RepID=F0ZKC0_DICPU|nr:uncharacterized protein DICPUDRAFT_152044 [Dictyostelium purpureum]EGC35630.1 hypothetical protein DICPUDRAFT_152044 [Dictyostelium purpureum]|eukprot:XP_003287867.1 hypothetical protein DICPUDRAFT_152044 [Dictyostelium purpureum]
MVEINDIIKLYSTRPNLELINKNFAVDCDFEAFNVPSFKVKGIDQIHEIFKAIGVYAKELRIVDYKYTHSSHNMVLDTKQEICFNFLPWFKIQYRMMINIHKNKEGKIKRFEEITDLESIIQNIPFFNYGYFNVMKPALGYLMVKAGGYNRGLVNEQTKIKDAMERLSDNFVEKKEINFSEPLIKLSKNFHGKDSGKVDFDDFNNSKKIDIKDGSNVWNKRPLPISN